jgi:hypothetical protein
MCSRVAWPSLLGMSGSGSIRAMDGNRFKGGDSWTTEHLYMSVSHPSSSLEHICVCSVWNRISPGGSVYLTHDLGLQPQINLAHKQYRVGLTHRAVERKQGSFVTGWPRLVPASKKLVIDVQVRQAPFVVQRTTSARRAIYSTCSLWLMR